MFHSTTSRADRDIPTCSKGNLRPNISGARARLVQPKQPPCSGGNHGVATSQLPKHFCPTLHKRRSVYGATQVVAYRQLHSRFHPPCPPPRAPEAP